MLALQVIEHQCVPSHGDFTAYVDGRVKVAFHDRTLLLLDATHTSATVTLRDGQLLAVRATNPQSAQPYVQAALEFATWAFKSF